MSNNSLSQYRQNQMSAIAPEKTVLMLYDGAIRFLRNAINELDENNDIVAKANSIEKTVKIIEYLQSCLDNEKGGEIALNLNRLYDYISIRLTEANLRNDTAKMREVVDLLNNIRDGWNSISDKNSANNNSTTDQTASYVQPPADSRFETTLESQPERKIGIKA